jgi:nicotinamide phosphoribosyltransferase
MSFKINPLHAVDSYKLGHRPAYPKGTTEVYSNWTPRSVRHLNVPEKYKTNEIVWFGGQAIITDMIEMWDEGFFDKPLSTGFGQGILADYAKRIAPFVGPNEYPLDHIKALHTLGYLPLEIKTLEEGSRVPVGVPVLTIRNTHEDFFWLTNYLESYLSAELWKMSTSATIADYYRKIITFWADKTGGNKDFIDFQGHDFSYRGMSGSIDSAKSGAGHLLSFKGTDVICAVDYLAYHHNGDETFVGMSVPAMEHSIQCSYADDLAYFRHIVKDVYPNGIVSVVCDGYDYWYVLTDILPALKDEILSRGADAMGFSKVVVRPDSGDPVDIVAGYRYGVYATLAQAKLDTHGIIDSGYEVIITPFSKIYNVIIVEEDKFGGIIKTIELKESELTLAEIKGSIQVLWDTFGGTVNEQGYKTLNQKIGLIYGDSITLERAEEILKRLEAKGFASDNVVLGIGSYTYQYVTRDTLGFAMKATNIVVDGEDIPLWKDPKTDNGVKKSAKGLLSVLPNNTSKFALYSNVSREQEELGLLTTLYIDGEWMKFQTLEDIRAVLAK